MTAGSMRVAGAIDIGGTRTKNGIVAALQPLIDEYRGDGTTSVAGVGVSVAGFLDPTRSTMVANANLPLLCNFPLRQALEQRFGLPCALEVDSNAAALGEYRHGAGQGAARLLVVTVG